MESESLPGTAQLCCHPGCYLPAEDLCRPALRDSRLSRTPGTAVPGYRLLRPFGICALNEFDSHKAICLFLIRVRQR